MQTQILKISCGDITKRLNFDLINSYEFLLEKAKISFNLKKEDTFTLLYNKKKISAKDFQSLKTSKKTIKLELILDKGNYILLTTQNNLNSRLMRDLEGSYFTFANPEQIDKSNINIMNQQLDYITQKISDIEKSIYQSNYDIRNKFDKINDFIDNSTIQKSLTPRKDNNSNLKSFGLKNQEHSNDKNSTNLKCSNCKSGINEVKYECLICKEKVILCRKCSEQHEHPLIQFYLNFDYKNLKDRKKIEEYIINRNNIQKIKPQCDLQLSLSNIAPSKIAISKEEKFIDLKVFNQSSHVFENLLLNFQGQKKFSINSFGPINNLNPNDESSVIFVVDCKEEIKNYYEETVTISLTNDEKINCKPLTITIVMVNNNELSKEKNLDFFLESNNYKINPNEDEKIKMISLIYESKDINECRNELHKLIKEIQKK